MRIASKGPAEGAHKNSCRVLREEAGTDAIKVAGDLYHGLLHHFRRFARVTQKRLDLPQAMSAKSHVPQRERRHESAGLRNRIPGPTKQGRCYQEKP